MNPLSFVTRFFSAMRNRILVLTDPQAYARSSVAEGIPARAIKFLDYSEKTYRDSLGFHTLGADAKKVALKTNFAIKP